MTDDAAKPLTVGVVRETFPGERRVALVPSGVAALKKAGLDVLVESGAGEGAGFPDALWEPAGATLAADRAAVFSQADVILKVRGGGADPEGLAAELQRCRAGQTVIASCDPLSAPEAIEQFATHQVTAFALELLPRITRAQSMDILSSMATVAGYRAVLLAATHLPRMFPMLMTAAGTLKPAKVFVVGAGVAGLQAIATAKRLGAVVQAYDVRPAVKEQVESLGGRFVEMELETQESEQSGGYAKEMDEDFYRRQREMMSRVVAECDVVITTAAIPGRKSPVLVTADMVRGMSPGSVIVDLAAERGGNCELTEAGQTVVREGVTILGPLNLPAEIPYHASEMYSRNISTFLLHLLEDGRLSLDRDDEIIRDTLLTRNGEVVNSRVRDLLPHLAAPRTDTAAVEEDADSQAPSASGPIEPSNETMSSRPADETLADGGTGAGPSESPSV